MISNVTSKPDWQHGLRLYQAYDRDAGVRDIKATVDVVANLPESIGKVAVVGYCLGALMTFLTAVRSTVAAAVAYHGDDTEKYLGEARQHFAGYRHRRPKGSLLGYETRKRLFPRAHRFSRRVLEPSVPVVSLFGPVVRRTLIRVRDRSNPLDIFYAVFDRNAQPQGRSVLNRQRYSVHFVAQ